MHPLRRPTVLLAIAVAIAAGCETGAPSPPGTLAGGAPTAVAVTTSTPIVSPSPTPTASPTASPTPTPVPPDVPYDPAKFGFRAKGMTNEMMVFMPVGQIKYVTEEMDWDVVSTVAFFSLEAGRDGGILKDNGWKAWISPRMDALIAKAHANGTKVVMSLERFSWSPGQTRLTRALLGSSVTRERLAREAAAEVARRGVDGVNVDFEPIPAGRKPQFTDFVRRLRRALDDQRPGYQLTFAITGHHSSYDVGASVGPDAADAVYLMGYHYAGTFSRIAGSNAPMGGPRYDVVDTVKSLLKLVEPHEIIVGVPYYGHVWPTANGNLNARTLGGGYDIQYHRAVGLARQIGLRYDKVQQVAWGRVRERACRTCPLRWYQLYFDDHRAFAHKLAFIKARKLLGGGVWTIGYEGGQGALTDATRKAFLAPAAPANP